MKRLVLVCVMLMTASGVAGLELSDADTPDTRQCQKQGSRMFIKTAEFRPASEEFCGSSCQSVANDDEECVYGNKDTICRRRFSVQDMREVYSWCDQGRSDNCSMDGLQDRLSQTADSFVFIYYCMSLEESVDPCVSTHRRTKSVYVDLSTSRRHRECTCTGRVTPAITKEDELVKMEYIYLINDVSPLDPRDPLVTVGEKTLNQSVFLDFIMLKPEASTFQLKLMFPSAGNVSGFLWLHFPDVEVSLSCTSSSSMTDSDLVVYGVVGGVVGVIVLVILIVVICIITKRYRRRQQHPPPSQSISTNPTTPPHAPQHPHPAQAPGDPPASDNPHPAAGCDQAYVTLQRHGAQPMAAQSTADVIYNHTEAPGEEYQVLDRGVRRQEVIDHVYDRTDDYGRSRQ